MTIFRSTVSLHFKKDLSAKVLVFTLRVYDCFVLLQFKYILNQMKKKISEKL